MTKSERVIQVAYNDPCKGVVAVLLGECYKHQMSWTSLGNKIGISAGTSHNYRKNPRQMTLEKLTLMMAELGIDEITIKIGGEDK